MHSHADIAWVTAHAKECTRCQCTITEPLLTVFQSTMLFVRRAKPLRQAHQQTGHHHLGLLLLETTPHFLRCSTQNLPLL